MKAGDYLTSLSAALSRLPGIGRRSADRLAMALAKEKDGLARELLHALSGVCEHVTFCGTCGALTSYDANPCRFCTDPRRDDSLLCVVEDAADIAVIERAGCFRGRYHALMGKVSPQGGTGPDDIRIKALVERVASGAFKELILALNTDVESDATAAYVADRLKPTGVAVSRIAFGIPVGSGIGYSDPMTLDRAIRGRQHMA